MTPLISPLRVAILSAVVMTAGAAFAQQNAPFDFSYNVMGKASLKPSLIFNDGADTYIQLAPGSGPMTTVGAQSSQQGPYLVIKGLPSEFSLRDSKRQTITIQYVGIGTPPSQEAEQGRVHQQQPSAAYVQSATVQPAQGAPVQHASVASDVKTNPFASVASSSSNGCEPPTVISTSTVAIEFPSGGSSLSSATIGRLQAEASKSGLQRVSILTSSDDSNAVRTQRGVSIGKAMLEAGLTKDQITSGGHSMLPGMYSVDFEFKKTFPCSSKGPIVAFEDGKLSVFASGDDLTLVGERVAKEMRLAFIVEGDPTAIPITANFAMTPYREGLAKIGEAITGNAALVLRDKEIVLRYSNK